MNKIKYNDFKNICRTCLLKCDLKFTQNNVILDVYYKLSGTSFETNDELPQQICLKCYEKINEIRTFSLQCKQSQTSLIECLNEFKNEPIQKEQETIENTNVQEIEEITIEEHKIQFEELYLPNDSVIDGLQIKSEKTDEFEVIIPELNINSLQDVSFNENVKNEETSDDNANQNDLNDTNSDKSDSTNINEVSNKVNKHLFKCDICNKSFKSLKVHSDERPLTCYTCTKTFKSSTELTRHKRIHTNERPFSCDICNKKFNHSSALSAHKRVHSNERLFECDVCTKSFKFARDLNVHKNLHNDMSLLERGKIFVDYEEICNFILQFEKAENVKLYKRDSRTIATMKKDCPLKVANAKQALKYYKILYTCSKGGKAFKKRGLGKRKRSTLRDGCEMKIQFTLSSNGQAYVLSDYNNTHNHSVCPEEFLLLAKQQKLHDNDKEEKKS